MKKLITCLLTVGLSFSVIAADRPQCNPVSIETCGLPYPSNFFTKPDSSSPTGLRLSLSDQILSREYQAVIDSGKGFSYGLLQKDSGFSVAAPVVFEVPDIPDIASLQSFNAVIAVDLDTGLPIPVRAKVVKWASNPLLGHRKRNVIEVFPLVRWEPKHTYFVALTKSFKKQDGGDFQTPAQLAQALNGSGAAANVYEQANQWLSSQGYDGKFYFSNFVYYP